MAFSRDTLKFWDASQCGSQVKAGAFEFLTKAREVMNGVVSGRMNKQVAGDLGIAE